MLFLTKQNIRSKKHLTKIETRTIQCTETIRKLIRKFKTKHYSQNISSTNLRYKEK